MPEAVAKKRRTPPELEGDDNRTRQTSMWMAGNGTATLAEFTHEGLSLSQQTRYSTLRKSGHWLEVRDELRGEVFYVDIETMKTYWEARKTPFRDTPVGGEVKKPRRKVSDAGEEAGAAVAGDDDASAGGASAPDPAAVPTLRERRMRYFKSLITHTTPADTPIAPPPALRFRAPPSQTKAPLPKRRTTASPAARGRRHIDPTKHAASPSPSPALRAGSSPGRAVRGGDAAAAVEPVMPTPKLFCPFTGHEFPQHMIAGRAKVRRAALVEFLTEHGVDAGDLALPSHRTDLTRAVRECNVHARAVFAQVSAAVPEDARSAFEDLLAAHAPPTSAEANADESAFPKIGDVVYTYTGQPVKVTRSFPNTGYVAVMREGARRSEAVRWGAEVRHYWD